MNFTVEEWQKERQQLLEKARHVIEGMPARGPLNVEEVWRREFWYYTEVKLTYEGYTPEDRIFAYLLIPRQEHSVPLPAIYAAHQCGCRCDLGKEQVVGKCPDEPDQAYGWELVRQGFIVLAPDAAYTGERCDPKLREPWERALHLHPWEGCAGREERTQGICCWAPQIWRSTYDIMRGVDLLCKLPQVDSGKIGIIGHSKGAKETLEAMLWDERLRAGVISAGGLWNPYVSHQEILSLLAPRPFFEVRGCDDGCSDQSLCMDEKMRDRREAHRAAKEVYGSFGDQNRLMLYEFEGGHEFPEHARKTAYAWLKNWLM